jgi:predicted nucleic acid-binding protein
VPALYLDSCVVIYPIEGQPTVHQAIAGVLRPSEGSAPDIFVSDLTRLECRVGALRDADDELLREYDAFFALPEVACVPMTSKVFDMAATLRASQRLKTPDALHLAAAICGGCDEFWTNDDRLSEASKGRVSVRILPPRAATGHE